VGWAFFEKTGFVNPENIGLEKKHMMFNTDETKAMIIWKVIS